MDWDGWDGGGDRHMLYTFYICPSPPSLHPPVPCLLGPLPPNRQAGYFAFYCLLQHCSPPVLPSPFSFLLEGLTCYCTHTATPHTPASPATCCTACRLLSFLSLSCTMPLPACLCFALSFFLSLLSSFSTIFHLPCLHAFLHARRRPARACAPQRRAARSRASHSILRAHGRWDGQAAGIRARACCHKPADACASRFACRNRRALRRLASPSAL